MHRTNLARDSFSGLIRIAYDYSYKGGAGKWDFSYPILGYYMKKKRKYKEVREMGERVLRSKSVFQIHSSWKYSFYVEALFAAILLVSLA